MFVHAEFSGVNAMPSILRVPAGQIFKNRLTFVDNMLHAAGVELHSVIIIDLIK